MVCYEAARQTEAGLSQVWTTDRRMEGGEMSETEKTPNERSVEEMKEKTLNGGG